MSRIPAIAALALCCIVVAFAKDRAPAFAEGRSILDLSGPNAIPPHASEETARDFYPEREPEAVPFTAPPIEFESTQSDLFESHLECGTPYASPACSEFQSADAGEHGLHHCCECCECCSRACVAGHVGWFVEFGASALQTDMPTSGFSRWPDDFGPAATATLGYEWESGLGVRGQVWGYHMEGDILERVEQLSYSYYGLYYYSSDYNSNYYYNSPLFYPPYLQRYTYANRLQVTAATAYLDIYKSIYARHGELTFGAGPAFGNLEFNFPPAGDSAQYYGGGVSAFGEGFYPVLRHRRFELGLSGGARFALLTGNWTLETHSDDDEHSDSMSIVEIEIGPEFRLRFGNSSDRYCFVQTLAEFQQWRSDRMGPTGGDTLALHGASVNFGVLW